MHNLLKPIVAYRRSAGRGFRARVHLVAGIPLVAAAPLLRQMAGSADGWAAFMRQARARYPVSGERTAIAWEPDFVPEAGPPGDYARITFQSTGPPRTREFVVLVRRDADWRVAMYGLTGG